VGEDDPAIEVSDDVVGEMIDPAAGELLACETPPALP
jgi:hypothetical protein